VEHRSSLVGWDKAGSAAAGPPDSMSTMVGRRPKRACPTLRFTLSVDCDVIDTNVEHSPLDVRCSALNVQRSHFLLLGTTMANVEITDSRWWSNFRSQMPAARTWAYFDHAAVAPLC